jgi:hypothetical protein
VEDNALINELIEPVSDIVLVARADLRTARAAFSRRFSSSPELAALAGVSAVSRYPSIKAPAVAIVTGALQSA